MSKQTSGSTSTNSGNVGSMGATTSSASAQNSNAQSVLNQSKDFQTMISVLKDMGVEDYEPRVVNQLLEFSYR